MQMNQQLFNSGLSDEELGLNALKAKKELKTMDKIIFGLACLTLTVVFGIAIYGAALNGAI